jgi:hypothetical protein
MVGDYIPQRSMEIERPNSFRARTHTVRTDRQKKGNVPGYEFLLRLSGTHQISGILVAGL